MPPQVSIMSKKRLNEIEDVLRHFIVDENISEVMMKICEIMKFDPEVRHI